MKNHPSQVRDMETKGEAMRITRAAQRTPTGRPTKVFLAAFGLAAGAVLLAATVVADDKDILSTVGRRPKIVLILANANSMAQTVDGAHSAIGGADSVDSKMRQAKDVLRDFIRNNSSADWAVATLNRDPSVSAANYKEFIYLQAGNGGSDFGSGKSYSQADGVWERWGGWYYPYSATATDGEGLVFTLPGKPAATAAEVAACITSGGSTHCHKDGLTVTPPAGQVWGQFHGWDGKTLESNYILRPLPAGTLLANATQCVVEYISSGSYYDFNLPNQTVTVTKIYYTRISTNASWGVVDGPVSVSYSYVQGFVSVGGGEASGGGAVANNQLTNDNGNNPITGTSQIPPYEDRNGVPGNACGSWELGPSTAPSVPLPATPGANKLAIASQLRRLDELVNFDSTRAKGAHYVMLGNIGTDVIAPVGKACINNSLEKGVVPYLQSLPANPCTKSYVIMVTDYIVGQDATDPCGTSHAAGALAALGVPVFTIFFGSQTAADCGSQCFVECLPANTGGSVVAPPGYFFVNNATDLKTALEAIVSRVDENSKDFATATVSSVQTQTQQMAFLSTFNGSSKRSIWSGRIKGYLLDANGNVAVSTKTVTDPVTNAAVSLTRVPSNDPTYLMWNAGANLGKIRPATLVWPVTNVWNTPDADGSLTILDPAVQGNYTVSSYLDQSTDTTTTIPTYSWPGRKILYAEEPSTAGTVPEAPKDWAFPVTIPAACTTTPNLANCGSWWKLKYWYLGYPRASATSNRDTSDVLRFIRGDRTKVAYEVGVQNGLYTALPQPNEAHLYNDITSTGVFNGQMRLGDIFHSDPQMMAVPNTFSYEGLTGYQDFKTTYKYRRQVLFAGANDGQLHGFDAGVFRRAQNATTCPDGTAADGSSASGGGCFDHGTGTELFAYIPRSVISNFDVLTHWLGYPSAPYHWTTDGGVSIGDVYISNNNANSTSATTRAWRTVLAGSTREGVFTYVSASAAAANMGSVYLLDVTQPDPLDAATHLATSGAKSPPGCLVSTSSPSSYPAAACATDSNTSRTEWPRILWEFNDTPSNGVPANASSVDPPPNVPSDLDAVGEIGSGLPDLGEAWSHPTIGRIEVKKGTTSGTINSHPCLADSAVTCEDLWVVIFGGGFHRERQNRQGNWLYVLNAETGEVLYKANKGTPNSNGTGTAKYFGSIPSEVAALDTNVDGYLDRLYFGDVNGRMWKLDLKADATHGVYAPSASRLASKITGWTPFLLFESQNAPVTCCAAGTNYWTALNAATNLPNSIYYRPSAAYLGINASSQVMIGLGWGSGERDDILGNGVAIGSNYATYNAYYVIDDPAAVTSTLHATDLTQVVATRTVTGSGTSASAMVGSTVACGTNVGKMTKGWYMNFPGWGEVEASSGNTMTGERVIAAPEVFAGHFLINTFTPSPVQILGTGACAYGGHAYQWDISVSMGGLTSSNCSTPPVGAVSGTDPHQVFITQTTIYTTQNGNVKAITMGATTEVTPTTPTLVRKSKLKNWKEVN
jgi:Tfp pilus tip-associated adhesin PilY1